jgi:osmotically-inducible protein OsmY
VIPRDLRQAVVGALRRDPVIDAARIAVLIDDTAVILGGAVRTYAEKCLAEEIARKVRGAAAVVNELEVRITVGDYRTDATLERVLREVFESLAGFDERPAVSVSRGWITLDGSVVWSFQKQLAEQVVRHIAGVRGITNRVGVLREG